MILRESTTRMLQNILEHCNINRTFLFCASVCMIKLINVLACTIAAVVIFVLVCQLDITMGYEPRPCVTLALLDSLHNIKTGL